MRERLAQSQLNTAKAVLEAVQAAHDALTSELTVQPRKKTEKPSASVPVPKEPTADKEVTGGECAKEVGEHTCRLPRENALHHDSVYKDFHKFEPPKSVARAPRKSKQKSEAALSVLSSETGSEGAGVAALAASGGDWEMPEYTGNAGTLYTSLADNSEPRYEVWFENFCELGAGPTEAEALQDAFRNTAEILTLISEAKIKVGASAGDWSSKRKSWNGSIVMAVHRFTAALAGVANQREEWSLFSGARP
jgi:hypothetical protein